MTRYLKICFVLLTVLAINIQSFAQDLGGIAVSSYSGVQGISTQPAYLGDFAYKWDINVISASASLLIKDLIPKSSINSTFYKGDRGSLSSVITSQSQDYFVNATIYLPSVAYRINEKSGVSFNWSVRAIGFGRATSGSLSFIAKSENGLKEFASLPLVDNAIGMVNSWQDLSLSYGRVILEKPKHKLNLGVAVKYLIGGGSGYTEFSNIDVTYDEQTNTVTDIQGNIALVFNNNIEEIAKEESTKLFSSAGYGFNFGLIYEYKNEEHLNREIDRVGEPNYLFRLSSSIVDMGKISFDASNYSGLYDLSLNQPISPGYFDNIKGLRDLATRLENAFDLKSKEFDVYKLRLPTAWSTNLDWNAYDHFYVNGLIDVTAVDLRTDIFKSQKLYGYRLGLRYEKTKYGFYTSLSYNDVNKGGMSISARYSLIYVGVANLITFNSDSSKRTLGLMTMIRVPILNKSKKGLKNIF